MPRHPSPTLLRVFFFVLFLFAAASANASINTVNTLVDENSTGTDFVAGN
jgi:hypothetical protein